MKDLTYTLALFFLFFVGCLSKNKPSIGKNEYLALCTNLDSAKFDTTKLHTLLTEALPVLSQNDSLIAMIYHKLGVANQRKGYDEKAIAHYKQSLAIRESIFQPNHPNIAKSHLNIAKASVNLSDYLAAANHAKKAIEISRKTHPIDTFELGDAYLTLGEIQTSLGELKTATDNFELATEYFKTGLEDRYIGRTARCHKVRATTLRRNRLPDQAVEQSLKALAIFQKRKEQEEIADVFNNLGLAYRDLNKYKEAITALNQSLKINQQENRDKEKANNFIELSKTYLGLLDLNKARAYADSSLIIRQNKDKNEVYETYSILGDIEKAKQQPDSSLIFYQKALLTLDTTFKNNNVLQNPSLNLKTFNRKVELVEVLKHKAHPLSIVYQKKHDVHYLQAALETYQLADKVVQVLRREMSDDASKYFWNETALPIYRKGITAAYALLELTKEEKYKVAALQFSERTKAPVLREGIADNDAKNLAFIPQYDLQCERELRSVVAIIEKNAAYGSNVDSQLSQARTKLYQFQESLKLKYPNYARHLDRLTDDTPLSISDIQNHLKDSTLVIEYAFGEDSSLYQFAITQTDFILCKKGLPKGFYQQAQRFIQSVSSDSLIKKNYKTAQTHYTESSFSLYQLLLEENLLSVDTHKIRHVCLIPEGILNFMPFDALTNKHVEEWQGRYYFESLLVNKYAFSRAFSLSPLHNNSSATPSVSRDYRADFVKLGAYAVDFKATHWKADKKSKGELPNAKKEIDSISAKFLNPGIYFNPTAIKKSFIRNAVHSDILHISTHGHSEGLLFEKKDSLDNDYELSIRDISVIPLHARLTFLSACESGTGTMQEGEGVLSLGRAFMLSGSQAVMMTLWSIPDGSTAKIATRFYDNYQEGATADVALQKAQLYFMDNAQSDLDLIPNKWAALTFVSDMPFKSIQKQSLNWVCWLISFVIFTLIGLRFKSKR